MPWRDFADALERAWRAEGHAVQRLDGPHADLRIDERGGQRVLVSARRYKAASHGIQPLQALHAEFQRQNASAGVYVLLQGTVSDNARAFAREHDLTLLEGDALAVLLHKAERATARAAT
jgi:restriction system protein